MKSTYTEFLNLFTFLREQPGCVKPSQPVVLVLSLSLDLLPLAMSCK